MDKKQEEKHAIGLLKLKAAANGLPPELTLVEIIGELTEIGRSQAEQAKAERRHAETNGIKNDVQTWYSEHRGEFKSRYQAAEAADRLRLFIVSFSTLYTWIREVE